MAADPHWQRQHGRRYAHLAATTLGTSTGATDTDPSDTERLGLTHLGGTRRPPAPEVEDTLLQQSGMQHFGESKALGETWLRILVTALIITVALLGSIFYQVYAIEIYENSQPRYEAISWIVILVGGSIVGVVALYIEVPSWWRAFKMWAGSVTRHKDTKYYLALSNIFICFLLAVTYLRVSALDQYYNTGWEVQVEYNESLNLPGFAFAAGGDYDDAALATLNANENECDFPAFESVTCPPTAFHATTNSLNISSGVFGYLDAVIFDPRELKAGYNNVTELADRVRLQTSLSYSSSDVERSYTSTLKLTPYIFVVTYDPRVDLELALHCGLVTFTRVPALASNSFIISVSTILDPRRAIAAKSDRLRCQEFYHDTLIMKDPSYTSYSFNIGSTTMLDPSVCDTNQSSDAWCVTEAILRFDSKLVTSLKSKPGISRTGILLNLGAVVGAVQFFMFFLSILAL